MHRSATRFGLIVTVALLAAATVAAQRAPSAAGPHLQPDAGGQAAAVKRVVDGIMQPYLAQGQRRAPRGQLWRRSPDLGAIVAISLHGHRYFFPYGKATDAGAPFTPETLVESAPALRRSPPRCSRWRSTATKSSLPLPLRSTCPKATGSGRNS